mgnify:CR=1 FL=1
MFVCFSDKGVKARLESEEAKELRGVFVRGEEDPFLGGQMVDEWGPKLGLLHLVVLPDGVMGARQAHALAPRRAHEPAVVERGCAEHCRIVRREHVRRGACHFHPHEPGPGTRKLPYPETSERAPVFLHHARDEQELAAGSHRRAPHERLPGGPGVRHVDLAPTVGSRVVRRDLGLAVPYEIGSDEIR